MLVPLVLLQALQNEGLPLETLLRYGLCYLEESQADFIIQQGGWVSDFDLIGDVPSVLTCGWYNQLHIMDIFVSLFPMHLCVM